MAQVKFRFDPTIYSTVIPSVTGGGTATTTDVTNEDGTITRTISYTSNPTRLYFGNQSTESTALLEVYEYPYTSSMTNFAYLFDGCTNLTYIDENSFKGVSRVTNVNYCFRNCSSLLSLNLINWNLSSATSRSNIFYGCSSLTTLNLSGLNMGSRTMASAVFTNCTSLQTVIMKNCTAANMNKIIQYIPTRSSSTYGALIHDAGVTPSTSYATYWKRMTTVNEVIKYKFTVGIDTLPATMTGYSNNYARIDNANGDGTITRTLAPFDGVTVPTAINFKSCSGLLSIEALEIPELNSFNSMFYGCTELTELDLTKFSAFTENNGKVTTLASMFYNCSKLTELDLSMLNIANVKSLASTFYGCTGLTTIDLSNFNTGSVTTIATMFNGCSSLTSVDISGWDLTNVTTATTPFNKCTSLNLIHMNNSKASSINTIISNLLSKTQDNMGAIIVMGVDDSGSIDSTTAASKYWNVFSILPIKYKFNSDVDTIPTLPTNTAFTYFDENDNGVVSRTIYTNNVPTSVNFIDQTSLIELEYLDISKITNMSNMFKNCTNLVKVNTDGWDVKNATNMSNMFNNCTNLIDLDTSEWNVGKVTNMSSMFNGCSSLIDLSISSWNVGNVTNMSSMFNGCSSLIELSISSWNVGNVTSIADMFNGCSSLIELNISSWNVGNVTDMSSMFAHCSSLKTPKINDWNVGNITSMENVFVDCQSLIHINLSGWDVHNITNMKGAFGDCKNLKSININDWSFNESVDAENMFNGCTSLSSIVMTNCEIDDINKLVTVVPNMENISKFFVSLNIDKNQLEVDMAESKNWVFSCGDRIGTIHLYNSKLMKGLFGNKKVKNIHLGDSFIK